MADLYSLVDEQRSYLSSLDRVTARQMHAAYSKVLDQAQRDYASFSAKLVAWKQAHPSMDPRGASPSRHWVFQQERYQQLIAQLESGLGYYAKVSSKAISSAQREAIGKSQADNEDLIRAALGGGKAAGAISLAILPRDAMEAMVGFASDGTPLNSLLRDRSNRTWQEASATLVNGVALGLGPNEIAGQLDHQLATLHWQNLRLARTETMRGYREAQRVNMLQNASVLSGWRWSSAADRRTCAICFSQHGRVFPLKYADPKDVPPDHAHHKGLGDLLAQPPHTHARVPDEVPV